MNISFRFDVEDSPCDDRDLLIDNIYVRDIILPDSYDMRPELPAIRNQGNQGSCSAQAASAIKEWHENEDINFKKHMSPQFVYNIRRNQPGFGMYPRDTMKILKKFGIVSEIDYPYFSEKKIGKDLLKKAENFRIDGYARIKTLESLKKSLIANGPCYISFPVYHYNYEFWKPKFVDQRMLGKHAVTVVGWTKDSFIIRNSWGRWWGKNGYTYYRFVDWGMHKECWTAMDEDSTPEGLERKVSKIAMKHTMIRFMVRKFLYRIWYAIKNFIL